MLFDEGRQCRVGGHVIGFAEERRIALDDLAHRRRVLAHDAPEILLRVPRVLRVQCGPLVVGQRPAPLDEDWPQPGLRVSLGQSRDGGANKGQGNEGGGQGASCHTRNTGRYGKG